MAAPYRKRIFSFKTFLADLSLLIIRLPSILNTVLSRRVHRSLVEKVMLAVTAVNDCVHCRRFHTILALRNGVSPEEIREILNGDLGGRGAADDYEMTALLYAQHVAETDRRPEPEATRRLRDFYGEERARDIRNYIQLIYFGNLSGNTHDAFISRIRGRPAERNNLLFELFFFLASAPFIYCFGLYGRLLRKGPGVEA